MDLRRLVRDSAAMLLDFDGPVCSVYAGRPAPTVAFRLRESLDRNGLRLPGGFAGHRDPLQILRWVGRAHPALAADVDELLRAEESIAIETAAPTPHADEFIGLARQAGKAIGIVSNNAESAISQYIARRGLADDIGVVVGRPSDLERMKPDPAPVTKATTELGVLPASCLLVGDSPSDMAAACAAQVRGIGYAKTPDRRAALTGAGAAVVVDCMGELVSALEAA